MYSTCIEVITEQCFVTICFSMHCIRGADLGRKQDADFWQGQAMICLMPCHRRAGTPKLWNREGSTFLRISYPCSQVLEVPNAGSSSTPFGQLGSRCPIVCIPEPRFR